MDNATQNNPNALEGYPSTAYNTTTDVNVPQEYTSIAAGATKGNVKSQDDNTSLADNVTNDDVNGPETYTSIAPGVEDYLPLEEESESDIKIPSSFEDILEDKSSKDVQENISKLRERVESVEKHTKELNDVIDYLTKDKDIVNKLDELSFHEADEKGCLRRMLWKLEKRITDLEALPEKESRRSELNTADWIQIKKPKRAKPKTSLDERFAPEAGDAVLQSVFGIKTNADIIYTLVRELEDMTEELRKWHEANSDILDMLNEIKTRVPSQKLCACVKGVQDMKKAIDTMTGGQFLMGNDIVFLNPKRFKCIETQLMEICRRLKDLENIIQQMKYYQTHMKAIKKKFAPYLASIISGEPLPGETEQEDIGLNQLHVRIKIIQQEMKKINEISAQLLESQNERDNRIARIKQEIELLRRLKVDKEDVEDVLTEKDDPSDMDNRVNNDILFGLLQYIAEFSNSCMSDLADIEDVWQRLLLDIREVVETKANKEQVKGLEKQLEKDRRVLLYIIKELKKLIGPQPDRRELKTFKCLSCGKDIKVKYKPEEPKEKEKSIPLKGMAKICSMGQKEKAKICPVLQKGMSKSDQLHKKPSSVSSIGLDLTCGAEDGRKRYCGGSHTVTTPQQRVTRPCHYQIITCVVSCPNQ